ncbi:NAD(P)-binding protein [Neolentinus lepideus HHB14362 ss-1]|uniref:NAD(P)-binding protein n=1 Tax=Neolentinus lepideus HHB14362 ss-1 TaxID=1314782 RepID=A0A165V5D8_9AGAM|nr:NAD(P)-binding protein [Neolentinus lepideus HHB14362 ss-1]
MSYPTSSKVFVLNRLVEDSGVQASGPSSHFSLTTHPVNPPSPQTPNSILVQILALSNDPLQLVWIRSDGKYPFHVLKGEPMRAYGIGRVLAVGDNVKKAKVGDLIFDTLAWAEYYTYEPTEAIGGRPLEFPLSTYLGILAWSGFTAYVGLKFVLDFKPGQSLIVSGAAGSVGHVVVQYAKNVLGASKVIAIAGSREKCAWLEKHGADHAVNYKSSEFTKELAEAVGPEGADAFFDNVAGPVYDAVLPIMKTRGKIAACGAMAQYNSKGTHDADTHIVILFKRLHLIGFTCGDYPSEFPGFEKEFTEVIKSGKMSIGEGTETVVNLRGRFEGIPETWEGLFHGKNNGKLVSVLAD